MGRGAAPAPAHGRGTARLATLNVPRGTLVHRSVQQGASVERRLGRGLGSLLGRPQSPSASGAALEPATSDASRGTGESGPIPAEIALDEIRPNPFQPRSVFDPEGLQELRASIQNHGVLQPIVLRRSGDGYEIVSGERRWRASRMAGLAAIPAVVRDAVSDDQMLELALVENLQRRDLDPMERARGYRSLQERLGLTQDEVARRVGLQRATVANHVRLLELEEPIQALLAAGRLSMGHARALLGEPESARRIEIARAIEREGLSVREVERLVRDGREATSPVELTPASAPGGGSKATQGEGDDDPPRASEPWARGLEERLKQALGTRVEIRNRTDAQGAISGQVVLNYYDRRQLEALCERLAPSRAL
ncbi:MAG: ParB/RepB/Spo0J family partition protein [Planctomycetota bacterium]